MIESWIALTVDLDAQHYVQPDQNGVVDESILHAFFLYLQEKGIRTTWFVRMDAQIEKLYGRADYLFDHYASLWSLCKSAGHEIGWHPHPWQKKDNQWIQNCNEEEILKELNGYAGMAKEQQCNVIRMGWGYMTNRIMDFLESNSFLVDSSAIPRPSYEWELSVKDWDGSPGKPYYPEYVNYKSPGWNGRTILEIPISTTRIAASYDTLPEVIRVMNPSYHHSIFTDAVQRWYQDNNHLVMVVHDTELSDHSTPHELLSFSLNQTIENLDYLLEWHTCRQSPLHFCTLSEIAALYSEGAIV